MYGCSPNWSEDWLSESDLEKILSILSDKIEPSPLGKERVSLNYGLHFTGGEPFLNFRVLLSAVEIANELKIPSTFVETNCFWCKSDEFTRERLIELKQKGLKGILISVNPFYLEYVPFERTERAIRISCEIFGENVMIYQLEYYYQFKNSGIKGKLTIEEYLKKVKVENMIGMVELFLMGRACYKLKDFYPKFPAKYFFGKKCFVPFLRKWHNHFDNYGNFIPGYCGGISLGNIRDLDFILKEGIALEKQPVLKFLVSENIKNLYEFAVKNFRYTELKEGYVSKCHLCVDIRKHLVEKTDEFEELVPAEFYSHLD